MFRRYNANGIRQSEDARKMMQILNVVEKACNIAKQQEEFKRLRWRSSES